MPQLKFNKKKHLYSINGKDLISVTTFIKKFFNEFDEKAVAKKVFYSNKKKGIHKTLREIKAEWKKSREEGNLVHKEIEQLIKKGLDNYSPSNKKSLIAYNVLSKIMMDEIIAIKPELMIYDEELGLAGTIDVFGYQTIHPDYDQVTLIDWKTNKEIKQKGFAKSTHSLMKEEEDCNYTHYTLQLSFYAYMLERQGFRIGKLLLIHLQNEGVTKYEVPYRKELVIEMLRMEGKLK